MWSFIFTDLSTTPIGEVLNATERDVSLPLNRLTSCAFKLRLDNPLANQIATTEGFIKAYRNGQLVHFGPIISAEEVADTGAATLAVNSMGAAWILGKRLANTTFSSATDRAQMIKTLIDSTNVSRDTGISTSGLPISAASAITYEAGPYRPILDIISELATSIDGFDWSFVPVENFAPGGITSNIIARFTAAPVFGEDRPEAVFEYGTGLRNISSYKSTVVRDTQANRVYHIVPTEENPLSPVVYAEDLVSQDKWGLVADVAQANLISASSRTALTQDHVAVRKEPRRLIEFLPHIDPASTGRLPQYGIDYGLGDTVQARIVYDGSIRLNASVRVWGVSFAIDNEGIEKVTLQLVES